MSILIPVCYQRTRFAIAAAAVFCAIYKTRFQKVLHVPKNEIYLKSQDF